MTRTRLDDLALFRGADPSVLQDAFAHARPFSLPGGRALFRAGEPAEDVYFLLNGALAAHADGSDGAARLIGHIRAGEPVGEMAALMGEAHSLSVSALRDSDLVALDRDAFVALTETHPQFSATLARLMLGRARAQRDGDPRAEPKVFALIAASPSIDGEARARELAAGLRALGRRAIVVGSDAAEQTPDWFDACERDHDVVILSARMADAAWFRVCLRQADRLWVMARPDARPSTPMPLSPEPDSPARRFRLTDLVWLEEGPATGAPARVWMDAIGAHRLLRWRGGPDADRLARLIAGVSVGLVLSGGGARAYAHVGAVRALREAGVTIDVAGGSSMGAIVACAVAMGWDDAEVSERVRAAFVTSNPLSDFRLPVVALTEGRKVAERLETHFGDTRFSDLEIPTFIASSDLAAGVLRVHKSGSVRDALRASIALPGVLPPVVDGDAVLVDGAVLDNFPVDVMRAMHRGPNVGVDVTRERGLIADDFRNPPGFFEWVFLNGPFAPPPIASLLMRAATANTPTTVGREVDMLVLPELADVELRDWTRFDAAVEAGYIAAARALERGADALKR